MTGMRGDRRERVGVPNGSTTEPERAPRHIPASWLVGITVGLFLLIALPVVVHGAPLADDYLICLRPVNEGYGSYLAEIWHDTGVVRPTRFIELGLISEACRSLPFGAIILVPLALKFVVAFLLYRLLRDMRLPAPWPEIGSAVWLLEPLGTEAALWPSALHVPLGLALALLALLLYRRDRIGWAGVATLGACLSIEQVIFAMPLAVWLTTPTRLRRRAALTAAAVVVAVLVAYTLWPGSNPRQALTLAERLHNALDKGEWYLFFPAVGLGLHSGVLGFVWAFPYSVAAVVAGGVAGASAMPGLLSGHRALPVDRRTVRSSALAVALLVFLVNLPLIVTEVGYSARTFTPTWLVVSWARSPGRPPRSRSSRSPSARRFVCARPSSTKRRPSGSPIGSPTAPWWPSATSRGRWSRRLPSVRSTCMSSTPNGRRGSSTTRAVGSRSGVAGCPIGVHDAPISTGPTS